MIHKKIHFRVALEQIIMTVSHWQRAESQSAVATDFLIIGAGLAGTSAAYVARQMGREVLIVDRRDPGLGASGRNAGFMITGLDTYHHRAVEMYGRSVAREMWQISRQTHAFWHEVIDRSQGAAQVDRCGSMLLAETPEEALELELAARAMEADGFEFEFISGDPLGRGYYAAIQKPYDAAVQPYQLVYATLAQSGASIIANDEVHSIEQLGPEQVVVTTHKHRITARKVLLCTNAYSTTLDPYFEGKVIPTRAQCLVTEPLPQPVINTCGYSDYGYLYYRTTFDGRFLIGGGRKDYRDQEGDIIEDRVTDNVQSVLERYMRRRFPELTAPVAYRWAGIMGFSVDGLPLVGTLPGKPDVGFAVGFHGHGVAMSAEVTRRAVEMLLKGVHPGAVSTDRLH